MSAATKPLADQPLAVQAVVIAAAVVVTVPVAIALFTLSAVVEGVALSILWRWFVVPVFAVPALSWAAAAGLSIVLAVARFKTPLQAEDPELAYGFWRRLAWMVGAPIYAVLMGGLLHLYMTRVAS